MSTAANRLHKFGAFEFQPLQRLVRRNGDVLKLTPKSSAILQHLIENRLHWVTKDELRALFWEGASYVQPNTIDRQISDIRNKLGGASSQFIESQYKLGWRFVAEVATVDLNPPSSPPDPTCGPPSHSSPDQWQEAPLPPRVKSPRQVSLSQGLAIAAACLGVTVLATGTYALLPQKLARVTDYTQVTNDGRAKWGPLLSDGKNLFFTEVIAGKVKAVSISLSGGDTTVLPISFHNPRLWDISSDGQRILLCAGQSVTDPARLWMCSVVGGPPEMVATGLIEGAIAPDGQSLAVAEGSSISVLALGGLPQKLPFEFPGEVQYPRFSPDGHRLRFSVFDPKKALYSTWEIVNAKARDISSELPGARGVVWTRDGADSIYEVGTDYQRDLWTRHEHYGIVPWRSRPQRLTNGQGSWSWPIQPTLKGSIFALNQLVRAELVELDPKLHEWRPVWGGAPILELNMSRDGRRLLYTHFPDHSIWSTNPDGGRAVRVTPKGLEAREAHWSPDGKRIAFLGVDANKRWRIFIVPASGGTPQQLMPNGGDQGVPTWSPDGNKLLFGEPLYRKAASEMTIYTFDLNTRTAREIPGSRGLWSPRWSNDGKWILALASDSRSLKITTAERPDWREIVRMRHIDHANWSFDSKYIYFDAWTGLPVRSIFRVRIQDQKLEKLEDLTDFKWPGDNWIGVAPDGKVLAFQAKTIEEIWALKCELP